MSTPHSYGYPEDNDLNVVEMWLRRDPTRWIAGALAGMFAIIVMIAFAMILCAASGADVWLPAKIGALPILGNSATEFGNMGGVVVGLIVQLVLGAILGLVYAHMTFTNALSALLGMGLVWGIFSWIFIFNLYIQSFRMVHAAHIPSGVAFPVLLVFGLSLTSVAFFDRALRGRR